MTAQVKYGRQRKADEESSARKTAFIKKLLLVSSHLPPKQQIPMWEATKLHNNVAMNVRMARRITAKLSIEFQCPILIFDALGVNEWRVEKQP